jgi:hypothetical protein
VTNEQIRAASRDIRRLLCKDRRRVYTPLYILTRFGRKHHEMAIREAVGRLLDGGVIEEKNFNHNKLRGVIKG